MNTKKIKILSGFLLFSIILLSFSCNKKDNRLDNSDVKKVQLHAEELVVVDTVYFKSTRMIPLETKDDAYIAYIKKIMFDEDKIFVFDQSLSKVFIFNENGDFLQAIDKKGQGPGEYMKLNAVCLDTDNKEIILIPDYPKKLFYFNYSGQFLREENSLNGYKEMVCNADKLYAIKSSVGLNNNYCYLYETDKKSQEAKCLFDLSDYPLSSFFTGGNYLTKGKHIHLGNKFDDNIYRIEHNALKISYTFDFGKYSLPEKYRQKNIPEDELQSACDSKKYIYNILEISEGNDYLFFNTNFPGLFIYSKKDDVLKKCSFIRDSRHGFHYSQMLAVENSENSIAFFITATYLYKLKQSDTSGNSNLADLFHQLRDLQEDSNPVLMICTFD